MNIQEITGQKEWNEFFNRSDSPSFLQSWEWGEFEQKMGYELIRLGLYDKNELKAITFVIKIKAKRGRFLFIPHGPIFSISNIKSQISNQKLIISQFLSFLVPLAKKENYLFIRIGPAMENTLQNQELFKNLGFKTAPIYIHSEDFWMLPLQKSEEELLADMRKTTRYLIKKALRDGVIIEKSTKSDSVKDFLKVYEETIKREQFSPYSDRYIKNEFEAFGKENNALFFFGKHEGKLLASALVLFTKAGAFYHQGASIHSKIPVPYLLQWEAIKEAKKRGCKFYNFWGILIPGRTPETWEGLTTFKTGFGGYDYRCVPTQDYIISKKYYLTYFYEKFLQWKRGV